MENKKIYNQEFTGERSLFMISDTTINGCRFYDGESPLKESHNLNIIDCDFEWKYPLWYSHAIKVKNSTFKDTARSGIWYTNDIEIEDSMLFAPKLFRRAKNIVIKNSSFTNAVETMWNCQNIKLINVLIKGNYFGLNSENLEIENTVVDGNYFLDGAKNVTVKNSKIISKDAFWNCESVYVKDSVIIGEYLAWNTKNIRFENCVIKSEQGLCYVEDLVIDDCELLNTNLAFEYSTVDAEIRNVIDSIKNPNSGKIEALGFKNIIFDENIKTNKNDTIIISKGDEENV